MLVLSRRLNEEICIPALGITIRVARISKQVVALAVDAPSHIRVLRSELLGNAGDKLDLQDQSGPSTDPLPVKVATRTLAPRRTVSAMTMQATSRIAR